MKTIFGFFLIIVSFSTFAQIKNLRVAVEANYSLIPSRESGPNSPIVVPAYTGYTIYSTNIASIKEGYSFKPGISLKGSFDMALSNRFYFRSGLTFSYINYHRSVTVEETPDGSAALISEEAFISQMYERLAGSPYPILWGYKVDEVYGSEGPVLEGNTRSQDLYPLIVENENKIGKTILVNVQVPILIGKNLNKGRIGIHAGVASVALYASTYKLDSFSAGKKTNTIEFTRFHSELERKTYTIELTPISFGAERKTNTNEFTPISFGAMVGLSYKVLNNMAVEVSGQHYFSSLYKEEFQEGGKARMNLVAAGISYQLR
jgi:hypothetical protein